MAAYKKALGNVQGVDPDNNYIALNGRNNCGHELAISIQWFKK
jgi:hypothetical protein